MSDKITRDMLNIAEKENKDFITMVVKSKYCKNDEKSFHDVINRVISDNNITDKNQINLLNSGDFIPGGSILSGDQNSSLSNCYFTPIQRDNIEAIFEANKELARTFSYRGGSGVDITVLRPAGEKVNNAAKTSSGAVSFMPLFNTTAKIIGQSGRRSAMLITLDIRHPDTLKFIWSKAKPDEVFEVDVYTGLTPVIDCANISLKLTDDFMKAVENDEMWTFYYPDITSNIEMYENEWDGDYDEWSGDWKLYNSVKAKDIFDQIAEASMLCGDPGVTFIDTTQTDTLGTYIHKNLKPVGYNPCGEQPLAPYNNCLLGAFVMSNYVENAWSNIAFFDEDRFLADIRTSVRIMNIFSDNNQVKHPLNKQKEADIFGKRIGIEMTGLADMFAMLGYRYKEQNSCDWFKKLLHKKAVVEISESVYIAKERGYPCPALNKESSRISLLDSQYISRLGLTESLKNDIINFGLANTGLNTIGPCGSISIVSGNCTGGIEPLFKFSYKRKTRINGESYNFIHYPAVKYMLSNFKLFENKTLQEAKDMLNYSEAEDVFWKDRIMFQSVVQKYCDASISSTINLAKNTSKEHIKHIYQYAWNNDLKGITVFVDGCKEGVLSSISYNTNEEYFNGLYERELLDIETAERHRVMWKGSKLYVNVSLDDEQPIEIFAKLPLTAGVNGDGTYNPVLWQERTSNWDLVCRLISMLFRYNIPLDTILEQLDKSSYSMVDAAGILSRILKKYKELPEYEDENSVGSKCESCGELCYFYEGGCGKCYACGYSSCG